MFDWLVAAPPPDADGGILPLVGQFSVAAGFGAFTAAVHYLTQRRTRAETAPFAATLVLLTILMAMVTGVIGNNAARAFGLVGALSIVRFRTALEDTRDAAFVVFAVVNGMAVGSGLVPIALGGAPVVAAAAWLMGYWGRGSVSPAGQATLFVRVKAGVDPDALLGGAFGRFLEGVRLTGVATARKGSVLDLAYAVGVRDKASAAALVAELTRVEGVVSVEWSAPAGGKKAK